jgi:hypothetical protein
MKIIKFLVLLNILFFYRNASAEEEWRWVDQGGRSVFFNNYPKSLTIPEAWGAYGNVLFMGVGGTKPSAYSSNADGAAIFGYGIGNPDKIAAHVVLASLDMSAWNRYSAFFHLCKNISKSGAVGIGAENIMLSKSGDSGKSIYVVYSNVFPISRETYDIDGHSKLYYTIGVGKGRFSNNSDMDISQGKHRHGTYVFGGLACEVANAFNVIADWNGLNLNAGIATTVLDNSPVPIAIMIGVADLTRYSGDRMRFIAGIGTAIKF